MNACKYHVMEMGNAGFGRDRTFEEWTVIRTSIADSYRSAKSSPELDDDMRQATLEPPDWMPGWLRSVSCHPQAEDAGNHSTVQLGDMDPPGSKTDSSHTD